jgi:hypothetical protein
MEEVTQPEQPKKPRAKTYNLTISNVSHHGGLTWSHEHKGDMEGFVDSIDEALKSAPQHIRMCDIDSLKSAIVDGVEWTCRVGKCVYSYTLKK